jgi:hypothetical protein
MTQDIGIGIQNLLSYKSKIWIYTLNYAIEYHSFDIEK